LSLITFFGEKLGMELENVAAFGDGDNDVEFLSYAGLGVAMNNAKDVAKDASKMITEFSNDENGVAIHLEKMIQEGYFD
jgi:hypothetical protein